MAPKKKDRKKPPPTPDTAFNGSSYSVFNSGRRDFTDYSALRQETRQRQQAATMGAAPMVGGTGTPIGIGGVPGVGPDGMLDPTEFDEAAPLERPDVPPLEEEIPQQNVDNSVLGKFFRFMDNIWFDDAGGMLRGESGFLADVPLYEETIGNVMEVGLSAGAGVIDALNWGSDQMNHLGAALMSAMPGGIQTLTWDQSQDISFGQVVMANAAINNKAGITGWLMQVPGSMLNVPASFAAAAGKMQDPDNILYSDKFNILDPEIRKDAFESGGMGQFASGFADAVWMVAADPLIIAGPTSSLIRFGSKAGKFAGLTNRALNNTAQIDRFGEEALLNGQIIAELGVDGARQSGRLSAQGEYLISAMEGKTDELFNHPFVRNANDKRSVQSLLGDTSIERPEEAAALVGAMAGHPGSWQKLRTLNADMYEATALALGVNPMAPVGSNLSDFATAGIKMTDEQRALGDDIIYERLADRQDLVDDIAASGQLIARGGARVGPRTVRAKNAWRAGAARQSMSNKPLSALASTDRPGQGHFVYDMIYGVAGSPPLRVVRWLGQGTPNGIVQLKEGADSMNSLDEFGAWMRKSPMDADTSRQFFNEFAAARTVQDRKNVVLAAEEAMIQAIAAESKGKITPEAARAAYAGYNSRRAALLEEAHRTENHFAVDPTTNEYVRMPGFYAELDQYFPLLDVKEFSRVVNNNRAFTYLGEGMQAADYVNSLWKISVLARLGYTQRNIAEGALRSLAVLGVAALNPKVLSTIPANAKYAARMRRGMRAADAELKRLTEAQQQLAQVRKTMEELQKVQPTLFGEIDDTLRQMGLLTIDEQKYIDEIDKLSQNIDNILKGVREAEAARFRVGRRENIMYDGAAMRGAFQDQEGSLAFTASSADVSTYITFDTSVARLYERLGMSPDFRRLDPAQLTPDQMPQYFAEYAVRLNFRYRSDPLGRMILSDMPLDDIIAQMRKVENKNYLRQMSQATGRDLDTDQGLRSYIDEQIRRINNEVPADSGLRQKLLETDVTAAEVSAALGSRDLPVIVGRLEDGMPSTTGFLGKTKSGIDKTTATLMKWLGTIPEDKLLRHPFYDTIYRREQDRLYRNAAARGVDMSSEIVRNRINRGAHRIALKSTRETLYTIDRLSNAAVMLRFISPFFPAWENSVRTWGRIAWTNPAVVGVGNILWNIPNNLGWVVDENGNRLDEDGKPLTANFLRDDGHFIVWPEPMVNFLNKTPFGSGQGMKSRQSGMNVIFPGGQWWFPGLGPAGGIPTALFLRGKPEDAEIIKNALGESVYNQIVPMGQVQGDVIDMFLPTIARRVRQMMNGESSDSAYLTTWNNIIEDEYIAVQLEDRPFTDADAKRAAEKADRFWKWQIGAAAAMPFQSTASSRWQVQRDYWQSLIDDTTLSYQQKIERFRESFNELESDDPLFGKGDAFMAITRSGTYTETKLKPNLTTWNRITKNKDVVDKLYAINPELVGMFGNMGSFDDPFSYAVYGEYGATRIGPDGNKISRKLRPSEIIRNNEIADGWKSWWRIKDSVEQKAIDLGYSSIQVKDAQPLRDILRDAEESLAQRYPAWIDEKRVYDNNFSDFLKGARIIVENEKLMNEDSTVRALASYLNIRDKIAEQLSGVTDQEVRDQIKQVGYAAAFQLRQTDIGFADFYDQYLARDDFRRN